MTYTPLSPSDREPKPATEQTSRANAAVRNELPFANRQSFADAKRGFIATLDPVTIMRGDRAIYDLSQMDFLDSEAPDTANPSLWRQAQLNAQHHGLYEITEGLYQVRSFDLANMTLIAGDTGWIVVDPLTSSEAAAAALKLANDHLGEREVTGVLITHSHIDHFGGILGVVSHDEAAAGDVPVIAPEHFTDESLSENVLAGNVMQRRATYMYGNLLRPGPQGFVSIGLGAALSMGSTGFVVPNDSITDTGETRRIDGVDIEFQMTPGTEAPAEFVFYLPRYKALCMSEITSHHLHNVYTPRGAQVRDALGWSTQINESIERLGNSSRSSSPRHHWPIWGRDEPRSSTSRSSATCISSSTTRRCGSPTMATTRRRSPNASSSRPSLGQEFYNRGYYGTRAPQQPSGLREVPRLLRWQSRHAAPAAAHACRERYLEYMGGADEIVARAREDFARGEYRWVAEVLNHIMMADPEHAQARALLADTLEQMGYQAESGPWRNFYLCGALELREGLPQGSNFRASEGVAQGMPLPNLFQMLAARLLPDAAEANPLAINVRLTEPEETWLLEVRHAVLNAYPDRHSDDADTTLVASALDFKRLMLGVVDAQALVEKGALSIEGNADALATLGSMMDTFPRRFPIVTPRS